MLAHDENPDTGGIDLGSLTTILPTVANTPDVTLAAAQLASAATPTRTAGFDAAAHALADAIVATTSPALFADAAQSFLASSDLLEAAGERLGTEVLAQSMPPGTGATEPEVLRAADALEAATQLRLGGWAPRWDLFALLASYDGTGSTTYSRAAIRAVQACFEQWPEAADLLPVAHRIAELGDHQSDSVSLSDTGVMFARVALLQALRADDREAALRHIDGALVALAAALAHDDRPDAHVTANIARLLQGLMATQTVDPTVASDLADSVRELRHLRYSRGHWTGEVTATTWAAWTLLADRLADAEKRFAEPSWLHAVPVIDDLVDLYQASSSHAGLRRNDDGRAVQVLVAPVIENGFANEVGLFNVLRQRVAEMQAAADEGTATESELVDLPAAIGIRDAAARRLVAGQPVHDPKAAAGAKVPADYDLQETYVEERLWATARRRHRTKLANASLPVNRALERIWTELDGSDDYRTLDGLADAVDIVTALLMAFLFDRSAVGPSEAPYLFDPSASEEHLARDLRTFVRGSGYLHGMDTEVRHVAGGRVDMRFSFPGFNLYVELKQDSTEEPVPDKSSYVNQAATYQAAEPRVGFLLVLKKTPKKTPAASVSNWAQVVETTDAEGAPRHVVAMTLAGARTIPSDM